MPAPMCLGSSSTDLWLPSELTQILCWQPPGPSSSSFIDSFLDLPIHHCPDRSQVAHPCDSLVGPALHSSLTSLVAICLASSWPAACCGYLLLGPFGDWRRSWYYHTQRGHRGSVHRQYSSPLWILSLETALVANVTHEDSDLSRPPVSSAQ